MQQVQLRKSKNYGVIFRMKKCLLNVWKAMKCDAYMHFAVMQLFPLFIKLKGWEQNQG